MNQWWKRRTAPGWTLAAALLAGALPLAALADEPVEARNRVRFRVESAREVANDWMRVVIGVSAEDVDPAALADTVNRAMAWALEQAREESRVEAESGGYQTHPVHEKGKLRRWRASQDLLLEGSDSKAMTTLVGLLQSRLQLRSFQFAVSHETRARVEEELVAEALDAFRSRAEIVRKSLDAGGYAIDDISIDTGAGRPQPVMRAQFAEAGMASSVAPPAVEGGSSRVTVAVHGTIALE
jgi:predicted secreted protein